MKLFLSKLRQIKGFVITLIVGVVFLVILMILRKQNIVHIALIEIETMLILSVIIFVFVFGSIVWVLMAPTIIRPIVMIPFAAATFAIFVLGFSRGEWYGVVGMVLISLSGVKALQKYKIIWISSFILYYVLGAIFFGYFEIGVFFLNLFGFGVATLNLYILGKPAHTIIAATTFVFPGLVLALITAFSVGSYISSPPSFLGPLAAPFADDIIFRQKTEDAFIDTIYVVEIYRPIGLNFYQQIGRSSTEGVLPTLNSDDFEWVFIDADTYQLNFYFYEGIMQYEMQIEL